MNMHVCGGCSSSGDLLGLRFNKLLLVVLCFSSLSEVYAFTVEWSLVSPYQLSQSKNNWYALQDGKSADIDFSKGGQVAFVPASRGYGYGLYNRGSPPVINLNLSKPKHGDASSSEEHKHKRKHHGDSSEEHSKHKPEHHQEHHPEHHKSAKEELNEEHAEQAEVSAGIADGLTKLSHFMREQMNKHVELRDQELNRGNEEAAKKEQAIIDMYQEQIKYLDGIEKIQEAIMKGEVGMALDDDGAGQKHGHHGHHGHHGDSDHEGHGNHHGGGEQHHGADQPRHHRSDDEDDDEEYGGHDDDDEGRDEEEYHGNDDDEDDDDDGHGGGKNHDEDDEEHDGHGSGHNGGHGHDHEGGGHGHEGGGHGHEGGGHGHEGQGHDHEGQGHDHEGQGHHPGGHQEDDEFHDATDKFDDNDPDYDPDNKHKLDRRSPFVSSFLPSLSGTDTSLKTPDTVSVDTTINADAAANSANIKTDTGVTTAPSATPYAADVPTSDAVTTSSTNVPAPPTPTVISPDANTNSGWFNWFGSSNTPVYSPYKLLEYLSPSDKSANNLMSMFNVFSDPSNNSYLANASTLMRIVMFFMPGTGIVDQVYFTMALSKIMWEAATMYYEGYGTVEIAVVVLGEMAEASYLSRRGEDSIISQKILTPGDTVKIDGMDVPAFLKYTKYMKYPDLTEAQEAKLQKDIDNLIAITYPNISPELKTTFIAGLKDTMRFLALFNVNGDLHVENVDVNFSDVYIKMHSAFDDSPLEKIKKTILSAIDAVKSNFN